MVVSLLAAYHCFNLFTVCTDFIINMANEILSRSLLNATGIHHTLVHSMQTAVYNQTVHTPLSPYCYHTQCCTRPLCPYSRCYQKPIVLCQCTQSSIDFCRIWHLNGIVVFWHVNCWIHGQIFKIWTEFHFHFFRHEISELRRPNATKLCYMIRTGVGL